MELSLIEINVHELVDQPTLATYMSEGEEVILEKNRPFYQNSKEICVQGIYFALTEFKEGEVNFRVLSLYKKSPRQKKTYRYAFGCYDQKKNKIYWFFNLDSVASSRDIAVKTMGALNTWCKTNAPSCTAFAYKK
jgi:hypothetical protein